jgi:hypothetical protein
MNGSQEPVFIGGDMIELGQVYESPDRRDVVMESGALAPRQVTVIEIYGDRAQWVRISDNRKSMRTRMRADRLARWHRVK